MRFISLRIVAVWLLAAVLGAGLLYTSQSVQNATDELNHLENSLMAEREALDVLNAEWEYLNSPQRLEKLAQQYFGMEMPKGENLLKEDAAMPFPSPIQNAPDGLLIETTHEVPTKVDVQ